MSIQIGGRQATGLYLGGQPVSKAYLGGNLVYGGGEPVTPTEYLTFSSPEAFTLAVGNASKNWDGALYWSVDTDNWTEWDGAAYIPAALHNGFYRIYMAGKGNTVITGGSGRQFSLTGTEIRCSGNVESLLDWSTVASGGHPTMSAECFRGLFRAQHSLVTAPDILAESLSYRCCAEMFLGDTGLTNLPKIQATEFANQCCFGMFYGCTKIKISKTKENEYTEEYRIPSSGTGTAAINALNSMFGNTGGAFTGTPEINTTYYLAPHVEPTLLYFTLTSNLTQPLYFTQSAANGVSIDWGDGSAAETYAGTEQTATDEDTGETTVTGYAVSASHTYAEAGDYVVKMTAGSGMTWSPGMAKPTGTTTTYYGILGAEGTKSSSYPTLTSCTFGQGAMLEQAAAFVACTSLGSFVIPDGITAIPRKCFYNCTGLESITIPPSVAQFGQDCFGRCEAISSVYIRDLAAWCNMTVPTVIDATTFVNGSTIHSPHTLYLDGAAVTDLVIPEGITRITSGAFRSCTSLTSVVLPTTMESLGLAVFRQCTSLASVTLNGMCERLYDGTITGNDRIVESAAGLFGGCSSLKRITVGNRWRYIRVGMFSGCTALEHVTIPGVVYSVGVDSFLACEGLETTEIAAREMEYGAFEKCTALQKVWIRNTVETISVSDSTNDGPFIGVDGDAVIYCEDTEVQEGWADGWNYYGTGLPLTTVYGQTTSPF